MTDELRVVKGAAARLRDGNPEPRVPCVLLLGELPISIAYIKP